jgi:hypothetical protein
MIQASRRTKLISALSRPAADFFCNCSPGPGDGAPGRCGCAPAAGRSPDLGSDAAPGQHRDAFLRANDERGDTGVAGGDACVGGHQLPEEREDQRVFLGVAQVGQVGGRDHPAVSVEAPVITSKKIRHTLDEILARWTRQRQWVM